MRKGKIIEIVWFMVVLGLFILSIKMLRSGGLEAQVASFGLLAPIVIIILKIITLVVAPLGGTPLYVISGALFGGVKGFLICILGDILGSSACFFLSRKFGSKILGFFAGPQNVEKVLKTVSIIDNVGSFTKARIGFVNMPELLSYAAGLSKIDFWKFTFINTFFYVPVDLILVFFGSQLVNLPTGYFFFYPVILILFALIGFGALYKDYQRQGGM